MNNFNKEQFWAGLKKFIETPADLSSVDIKNKMMAMDPEVQNKENGNSNSSFDMQNILKALVSTIFNLSIWEGFIIGAVIGAGSIFTSLSYLALIAGVVYIALRAITKLRSSRLISLAIGLYLGVIGASIVYLSYLYEAFVINTIRVKAMLLGSYEMLFVFIMIALSIWIISGTDKTITLETWGLKIGSLLLALIAGVLVSLIDLIPGNGETIIALAIFTIILLQFNRNSMHNIAIIIMLLISSTASIVLWKQNVAFIYEYHGPYAALNAGIGNFSIICLITLIPLIVSCISGSHEGYPRIQE